MDKIDVLLKKQCYIIDLLPKKVPADSKGSFFDVESYFLGHNKNGQCRNGTAYAGGAFCRILHHKFTFILLKLMCFYPISIFSYDHSKLTEHPAPQTAIDMIGQAKDTLGILIGEDTLLLFEKDSLHLSVYNPDSDMQEIFSSLARAEGLFWRKAD